MASSPVGRGQREELEGVVAALRACATEQDIVQVLYGRLRPLFGYEVINLHVLDREGWFHHIPVDEGVLQDAQYRRLADSVVEPFYRAGTTQVMYPTLPPEEAFTSRGPGGARAPRTLIWVPVEHQGSLIGSVLYQTYTERPVSADEIAFLEEIHSHLGLLLANAHLNVLTRHQSLRLGALNEIARALASTLDEREILAALHTTVSRIIPVDRVALALPGPGDELRLLTHTMRGFTTRTVRRGGGTLEGAREVLGGAGPTLHQRSEPGSRVRSVMWVPIKEGGEVRGALSLQTGAQDAYEQSTVDFAVQVADQAALALRNAWSYSASEARRRRLEVVNGVGRRLISSLDRWSIMRTLREELALHLEFDVFILAALHDGPDGKPLAEGYGYDSGHEQRVPTVPLAVAGPSREAYETKDAVILKRNPWARSVEAQRPAHESLLATEGAAFFVSRPGRRHRTIARSVIWVPVLHGDRVSALLSVQSYRDGAFDEEDVKLLQDIAAHVSLALDNADHYTAAQVERRRLEALHVIELAVAGSVDEAGIAEAVFNGVSQYLHADILLLSYLDREGKATGYGTAPAAGFQELPPMPVETTRNFRLVLESGRTLQETFDDSNPDQGAVWRDGDDRRMPRQVVWVPVFQEGRVVAALSAQRFQGEPFAEVEVQLLESTAPLVGIALRTVRLHRANELALDHSLRIQEVAGLAGHDLASVVHSIAEQALTMFKATGVCCWAFDAERRVSAAMWSGDERAERVLAWSGWSSARGGAQAPPHGVAASGENAAGGWRLLPLWYADRLVGAIGSIHSAGSGVEEPGGPELDFARHSAVAIENARLAAETRGRIRTLEAVAAFTELDPTRPDWTRAEMAGLIERALAPAGTLWLVEGAALVAAGASPRRVSLPDPAWLVPALRAERPSPKLSRFLVELGGKDLLVTPILVDGALGGLMTAAVQDAPPNETRRLMAVLSGQAGVVLGRLRLVDALERERGMMNAILEHSPVGVTFQDAAGHIVYANPAVERLYDVPAAGMVGRSLEEVLAGVRATPIADADAEERAGRELKIQSPDRVVNLREVTIPGRGGEPEGILSMHEDVTQQRQVMEAKDFMLRAIGHEVRSPAAAMKNVLASVLQWNDQIDSAQRFELIEEAYEMSDRLLSLVEGQLIISKLETRRFEPSPAPVSVELVIGQVMGVLTHRYGERTGAVSVRVDRGLPAAFCEPTHLSQVLTNLIGNALEYTSGAIDVRARAEGGWLEISVGDHGPGLPADRVSSLFQKAGAAGRNRSRGGLGLGLYLCRLVVERSFGGRIWLDGRPGGSTFRFTVPSAALRAEDAAAVGG